MLSPQRRALSFFAFLVSMSAATVLAADSSPTKPKPKPATINGRWDLVVHDADESYPSWLEVRQSGSSLTGSFVGRFGSARPISRVEFKDGNVRFVLPPQFEARKDDLVFEGKLAGDALQGM